MVPMSHLVAKFGGSQVGKTGEGVVQQVLCSKKEVRGQLSRLLKASRPWCQLT